MLAVACLGFSAALHVASGWVQYPEITQCTGVKDPHILIDSVTITNSQLGQVVDITTDVHSIATVDSNLVLKISTSTVDGRELPCVEAVMPCQLRLCNGETILERELNREWNNQCPIPAGNYKAHMSFYLPNHPLAELYFKDGSVVINLSVEEDGRVVGCASYPVTVRFGV